MNDRISSIEDRLSDIDSRPISHRSILEKIGEPSK